MTDDPIVARLREIIRQSFPDEPEWSVRVIERRLRALLADVAIEYAARYCALSSWKAEVMGIHQRFGVTEKP